jgi:hypothetical protein
MEKIYRPIIPTLEELKKNKADILKEYNNYLSIHDYIAEIIMDIFPDESKENREIVQMVKDRYSISIDGFLYSYEPIANDRNEPTILECIFDSVKGIQYLTEAMDILDIDYECKICFVRAACLNDIININGSWKMKCEEANNIIEGSFCYYILTKIKRILIN